MKTTHAILAVSIAAFLTACASPGAPGTTAVSVAKADEHAAHQAATASGTPSAPMHEHMKQMQVMRDRMASARTPEERQALMTEHMKSMHNGMAMMKGMEGMPGMQNAPTDPAQRQRMMEMRMDMMQTMMEMMMQRMPSSGSAPSSH